MNVEYIKKNLSARGLLGWESYYNLEPYGEKRADHRAAQIVGMIFNMAVDVKHRKPYTEWLLKFKEVEQTTKKQPTKEQLAQKQRELLSIYARAYSGADIVEDTATDKKEQARLQREVAKARAAMGEK